MDRSPSPPALPPAPWVFTPAKPSATFVQADRSTFKELVQRLTGQTAAVAPATTTNGATARRGAAVLRPPTALRKPALKPEHHYRSKLTIVRPDRRLSGFISPKALSPSTSSFMDGPCMLKLNKAADLPSPASASTLAEEVVMDEAEEENAIKERGFCLHPSSPSGRNGCAGEPKLLTLFPLTSPYSKESSELRDI